jgi:xanthine/CO dehydrogenase XdhC/CoxF family maturation factor
MSTLPQRDLYRMLDEAGERGERVVVATVAHTRGSTPQRRGAKMLFFQNGEVVGTVGGGCIEAEVWAAAREAIRTGKSELHHYSLTADEASEEGMVCGGTMDIFVEVLGWLPIAHFRLPIAYFWLLIVQLHVSRYFRLESAIGNPKSQSQFKPYVQRPSDKLQIKAPASTQQADA